MRIITNLIFCVVVFPLFAVLGNAAYAQTPTPAAAEESVHSSQLDTSGAPSPNKLPVTSNETSSQTDDADESLSSTSTKTNEKEVKNPLSAIGLFFMQNIAKVIGIIIVWFIVVVVVISFRHFLRKIDDKLERADPGKRRIMVIARLVKYVAIFFGLLATVNILGLSQTFAAFLTAAGVFGLVVGLGVKDFIASLISGLWLMFDKPFVEGDDVEIGSYRGRVNKIAIRQVSLIRQDGTEVYIPTTTVTSSAIINHSSIDYKKGTLDIIIPKNTDITDISHKIHQILGEDERIIKDKPLFVLVQDILNGNITLKVEYFTCNADYITTMSDMKKRINDLTKTLANSH